MSVYHILVVGGRDFHVSCFCELGVKYTLLQLEDAVTDYQRETAEKLIILDYQDIPTVLPVAADLHRDHGFDAVMSFTEFGLLPAAEIAANLGLKTNCRLETVRCTRDKSLMRERLADGSHPVSHAVVSSASELAAFVAHEARDVIVKPVDGVGSQGVFLVRSPEEVDAAIQYARGVGADLLIAESFIGGDEFSVESLSKNGRHEILAITEKMTTGAPNFVELGHNQPASLSVEMKQAIHREVEFLLDRVGQETGPCHTEVKLYKGDVYVIETQCRAGGDNIWEMTRITTGADVYKETIVHLLGLSPLVRSVCADHAAVRFFQPPPGRLEKIHGIESARALPGVLHLQLNVKEHGEIKPITCSTARAGYVVCTGGTSTEVTDIARQVLNSVDFVVEPSPPAWA